MEPAQRIAKQLSPAITRLNALLVPLAHGACDGHGVKIGTEHELRERLLVVVRDAQSALVRAHQQLTQAPLATKEGNPS